jgi:hypothetical protein
LTMDGSSGDRSNRRLTDILDHKFVRAPGAVITPLPVEVS